LVLASVLCVGQSEPLPLEQPSRPAHPNAAQDEKSGGETDPAPDAPSANKADQEKRIEKQEQSYRVMGVVPLFGTTSRLDAPPLTLGEKFRLFARSAFDPVNFAVIGTQAGISQARDSFPGYGQGAVGYGKRYGAAFTDSVDANFFSNFFYPTLLKQDPRYFRLGKGTVKHRIWYAIKQEFVAHTDAGDRAFHFSNVLGALTAGGISNAYYPVADRGFGLTLSRCGIAWLYGVGGGIFSEFWPGIQNKIIHKNKPETPKADPGLLAPAFEPQNRNDSRLLLAEND
jgi:hypothetical protein